MESLSKQELISSLTRQADQIKRYEARLRDVVAAYKGLAKEKEALEISLKALNKSDDSEKTEDGSVAALTLSLSALSEEKARLEEAFQADKKVTRDKYENTIAVLKEETRSLIQQHVAEVNNLKAKIAYEIQEREKERVDHAAMLKELHMKLHSERKTKEKQEGKVHSSDAQASQAELEKRVRDLSSSLEAAERRLQRVSARENETPALLVRLQQKQALLEQSHSIAIREEQIKAKRVEEAARKICARQEERVALLEGKIAELSQTVGEYDARRRRDEKLIQQLQASLNGRLLESACGSANIIVSEDSQQRSATDNEKLADSEYLQTIIDKIHILKKELIAENEKLGSPIDVNVVLKIENYDNIHQKCIEEFESLKLEFEMYKKQNAKVNNKDGEEAQKEIDSLKKEVFLLSEKVDTYKLLLEEERIEKADAMKRSEEELKNERDFHKETITDLKGRIQTLENQAKIQRDRFAALLEETDSYIKAGERSRRISVESAGRLGTEAPPHMLHYAQELARKDLDIAQLRREKHSLEGNYRDCQREATIEKERFKEVIRTLREEIDRLRRTKSREGANLEYLKNVVISYLMTSEAAGRRHMLNAIAAVLHFTDSEKNAVMSIL